MRAEEEIIAGRLPGDQGQPPHHRFIVTVFGLYGRHSGGVIPVAVIVRLLQELGAEPASVRSSISRLKKKGVLVSERVDGQSGYALAGELEEHFRTGDERIFFPRPARAGDPWLLVSFSVPEAERSQRHKIRSGLGRMGFGAVGPGLWVAPAHLREEAADYVRRNGLEEYVEFFLSQHAGPGDLKAKVAQWWDLATLEAHYAAFIDAYAPVLAAWQGRPGRDDQTCREAFCAYVPMVTQWRQLPFLDPGLPAEALPEGWKGEAARTLFRELHTLLGPLSARHAQRAIYG
ncbi:transcriptional regulator [Arthrobacter sp. I2-34]|uniref:Transcriptional regulator n=1 Tax=Arthrobacter hankyongi TaxID=2904801 RepID=A0ABS9LDT6_9MICC|nr:PaaX family transcriptional regulator C-terminal domain-containing protein [Arthrobacter hankyongi]MCG2624810.1 transcriptional regulator [Arthrobacter hankyongi]